MCVQALNRSRKNYALRAVVMAGGAMFAASSAPAAEPAASAPRPSETYPVVGMTAPIRTATLASVQPARIAEILVKEGGFVGAGELVIKLEDGPQQARTEMAKASADSSLNVDLMRARWMRAKRDLDRLVRLNGSDFASTKEMSDAMADEEVSRLEYELAYFNQGQAALAYQRERALWDEFHIRAPFNAYVVTHIKHRGESVDQLEGIVTLVQLDPLQVTVDCPLALAAMISDGDQCPVRPADPRWKPRQGTVVLASRVADGGSQTFKVKLNVPNEDTQWVAGLKVTVDFLTQGPGDRNATGTSPSGSNSAGRTTGSGKP